ncbi:MAG: DUF2993 domain-containing protein [Halothece sp. Uz-M2-17]|nr:DUF2993 domain-containing protein [Halothece sp. Uz-M2-17]
MIWKKSHFLKSILTPALRIWLSSQLETIQGLTLELTSSDQQLLQGIIPKVLLKSDFAIYQGLHFDQIYLTAEQIQVNLSHLLKGYPLQPLNPIPLSGKIRITDHHLNASLASPLLQSGVQDLLALLLKTETLPPIQWEKITLDHHQFILEGSQSSSPLKPAKIQAQVTLNSPQHLLISPVKIEGLNIKEETVSAVEFNLGSQVDLKDIKISEEAIILAGRLIIHN